MEENKTEGDSNINQAATEEFFRRDEDVSFDRIIEELVKACQKTKKKDEDQRKTTSEEFPRLTDIIPKPSAPHWPNISARQTFSACWKDGRIELGFHVTGSEEHYRLTGGKSSKQSGDEKSWSPHDIGMLF